MDMYNFKKKKKKKKNFAFKTLHIKDLIDTHIKTHMYSKNTHYNH